MRKRFLLAMIVSAIFVYAQSNLSRINTYESLLHDLTGNYTLIAFGQYDKISYPQSELKTATTVSEISIGQCSFGNYLPIRLQQGDFKIDGFIRSDHEQNLENRTDLSDLEMRCFGFYDNQLTERNDTLGLIRYINVKGRVASLERNWGYVTIGNELKKIGITLNDGQAVLFVYIIPLGEFWVYKKD